MIDAKLTTFINVATLNSYTRAAEMLNLTQPAVSQHIKQLEEHYGVKLIIKKGRQIYLTEEGELLLQRAKSLLADSVALERAIRNKSSVVKRYNIGATLTIGEFVLPQLLGEYKKLHPNIEIIMHVNNTETVENRLSSGEFDLCIIEGPFNRARFNYKKLKDDELVLVTSKFSDFYERGVVSLREIISGGKLILREKGSGTRVVFEDKLKELGVNLSEMKVYMEVGSIGAIKSLVEANLGYTVISMEAVRKEVESHMLKIVPIYGVRIMREFNFIYTDNGQADFINGFMAFLTERTKE